MERICTLSERTIQNECIKKNILLEWNRYSKQVHKNGNTNIAAPLLSKSNHETESVRERHSQIYLIY